ncbi:hypothetical protein HD554DRAFT_21961 [Boletus coccyginus]|nr:hypothetical protein HD554DRAFT_21961 [Boletus coccyginus]
MCNGNISGLLYALKVAMKRYELNPGGEGETMVLLYLVKTQSQRKLSHSRSNAEARPSLVTRSLPYNALRGIDGIPNFHQAVSFRGHSILIFELLGCKLDCVYVFFGGDHSSFLRFIPSVDNWGVLRRDIKPHNNLLPRSGKLKAYLIDFGLADPFEDGECGQISSVLLAHRPS